MPQRVDRLAAQADVPGGGPLETGEHQERGGLAGARRAEQREEFAFGDAEVEMVDDVGLTVVGLADVVEGDEHVFDGLVPDPPPP
jgi:hypothetical protein